MRLVLISGHSGSGKSVALAALEDGGYYCVDNLPASLLGNLIEVYQQGPSRGTRGLAVGIDARAPKEDLHALPERLRVLTCRHPALVVTRLFLEATSERLIARFSETRRRHPLSRDLTDLASAVERETQLLADMRADADLVIDTSNTNVHQLRALIRERILGPRREGPSVLLQSFGFKRGLPLDSDFVFDVRHLPNPHWEQNLRHHSGLELPVRDFLGQYPEVNDTLDDIFSYLRGTLTRFAESDRSYVTVSIGCTGGKHRSVYLVDQLHSLLAPEVPGLKQRHRDLQ